MKIYLFALSMVFASPALFAQAAGKEGGGRIGATAVYLNFTSYGTGIDYASLRIAERVIAEETDLGNVIEHVRRQQGREGETYICVDFNNVSSRLKMMQEVAPSVREDRAVTARERTSVKVGFDCSDYDAATEQDLSAY